MNGEIPSGYKKTTHGHHFFRNLNVNWDCLRTNDIAFIFLLSNTEEKQINNFQSGANRQGLNFDLIRSFSLPKPSLPEQRKIASILSSVDETLEAEGNYRSLLEVTKNGLMQDLLTGKKRVKVDGHE